MLKAERQELAKVVRLRVKVAKNEVDKRVTRMLADVEAQLAARYPSNHPAWKEITKQAEGYIAQSDEAITERCRALGIPEEFRAGLNFIWYGRGESAVASRRAELRKVAQTELAARAIDASGHVSRRTRSMASGRADRDRPPRRLEILTRR